MGEKTLGDIFKNKKFSYNVIILIVFLIFGFYLRYYHVNYPVIGYHNWKSAHYLTEARNFAEDGFFKEGFFVPMRDTMNNPDEPPSGAHYDTFPMEPIIIALSFRMFGESLRTARLVEIFFSLGSVVMFYFFIKELFDNKKLALLCAFLATINPMFVFFSHNIQLVNSGLFFMLCGMYFYAKWLKKINIQKNLYLAVLFIAISSMTKYTFAVVAIPILFSFPYKKILKNPKKFHTMLLISLIIASIFPAWFFYSEKIVKQQTMGQLLLTEGGKKGYSLTGLIDFSVIGDKSFWQTLNAYANDNFTLLAIKIAMIGCVFLAYVVLMKKNHSEKYKFMFGYFFGLFVFLFVMGFKLSGHNYHQFPIAPFILFSIAFVIEFISENIKPFVSKELGKYLFLVLAVILIIILWKPSQEARDRMYNTQFPGLDIAGSYINQHKLPGERVLHSSGQSYGFFWEADMPGYKGPGDIERLKKSVEQYNCSWIFVYQWGMQYYFQDPVIFEYLKNNFHLVQFAYRLNNDKPVPLYFLFYKGGSFDDTKLNELLVDKPINKMEYYFTNSPYEIYYINVE